MTSDGVPTARHVDNTIAYVDGLIARPQGFRPLLIDLIVPVSDQPVPVVIYIHGGGFSSGSHKLAWSPMAALIAGPVLAAGYALATVQYRLSGEAEYPAQIHDVKAAVRWLRHHGDHLGVDASAIAAWGGSAGGYLAAMLATTADIARFDGEIGITGYSTAISAAVSWYGPMDFARQPPLGPAHFGLTDPADDGVPIEQSELLHAAYQEQGAYSEFESIAGAGHTFSGVDDLGPLVDRGISFLRRHLAPN